MNPLSLWSTTPVLQLRKCLGEGVLPPSEAALEAAVTSGADGATIRMLGLAAVVGSRVMATISAAAEVGVEEGLAGRIMTSLKGIVTLPSTSSLTGQCWKKSILLGF